MCWNWLKQFLALKSIKGCHAKFYAKYCYPGVVVFEWPMQDCIPGSSVARAFPGGRLTHPEDQNEEENEKNLKKNERKYRKMRKIEEMPYIAHLGMRGWLRPWFQGI